MPEPEEMLVKMNLSRAAKKFREQEPRAEKPAGAKAKAEAPPAEAPPAVVPTPVPPPAPEPVSTAPAEVAAPVPAAPPDEARPEKAKRPRFVRAPAGKRERSAAPALPPRSTKFAAQLLTKNLAPPPKDEDLKAGR